jgi:hypothetical protein
MNHAKPTGPDEMYGTNETKKLRRRKGRREDDGRHAWLPTAKRISSVSGWILQRDTQQHIPSLSQVIKHFEINCTILSSLGSRQLATPSGMSLLLWNTLFIILATKS